MTTSISRVQAMTAGLALALLPLALPAQTPPDFAGYWMYSRADTSAETAEFADSLPDDVGLIDDAGGAEFGPGEFGELRPREAALARAAEWSPHDELHPENACVVPGIIYSMQGPFPIKIHQDTNLIVIQLEYFDLVRLVFMDGRERPPENVPPSKTGFSLGRWEGDTLVVETTHLAASTITNNGLEHSDNVRLEERFWLSDDGRSLWGTQLFEDPDTLHNRGARLMRWDRRDGHIYPYECDPFVYADMFDD